jgi:methionyl-tRNA formyltransferase
VIIKVLTSYGGEAYNATINLLQGRGHVIYTPQHFYCDLIVCPDYDVLLTPEEINGAVKGALIFHPSPLPRMRGRNAIKRQYASGDKVGGGTWFWADEKIDSGDICEQEVILIDPSVRPRDYYNNRIIPLMLRTLERAMAGIEAGNARRVKVYGKTEG